MPARHQLCFTIYLFVLTIQASVFASEPTSQEADRFVANAEKELHDLWLPAMRASWVAETFITDDTRAIADDAWTTWDTVAVRYANETARYKGLNLSFDTRHKLDLLRSALTLPSPPDPGKTRTLVEIQSSMSSRYSKGKYCQSENNCLDLVLLSKRMAASRDPQELLEIWQGWREVSPPMRDEYTQLVAIANEGSANLGFADTGAMWRSGYNMHQDEFAAEVDRLWLQVKPLYGSLQCHVRARLSDHYGADIVPLDQPIPAHLLGNMWAQSWENIYDITAPKDADPGINLTKQILASGMDEIEMVRKGEAFFTSLGLETLPDSFWKKSMIVQPRDRDVNCHASAWSLDGKKDVRIKMCTQKTAEDFQTVHHELGHIFYDLAYNHHSPSYQSGAHDGFHEAIGDTISLSMTPAYLKQINLIEEVPDASKDIGLLIKKAMESIAFLPFSLVVDQWRWQVFSGETTPETYNKGWWELRTEYQGIRPPVTRSEENFDPGAKYHVADSVPYTRYFLARILQFQLHQSLCDIAGVKGPLHRCSIYGNKEAGARLEEMMSLGASRPWQETLKVVTGTGRMDARPILAYFAPLQDWLHEQNQGRKCGW